MKTCYLEQFSDGFPIVETNVLPTYFKELRKMIRFEYISAAVMNFTMLKLTNPDSVEVCIETVDPVGF